jgi:hypothetical protein
MPEAVDECGNRKSKRVRRQNNTFKIKIGGSLASAGASASGPAYKRTHPSRPSVRPSGIGGASFVGAPQKVREVH